jgi:ABC-2 type transport system ATP-binding protein
MFYRALIEKYAKSPCTVVISTHLIQEAAPLIERAVIIREGSLLCDRPVDELLGGVYNVSGPALKVDEYIAGKSVLSQKTIGGLKTACIEGNPEELPNGLELSRVELQDYFINLMNKENEK